MDELIRKQDALNAFCLDNRMFLPRNSGRTGTYIKMVMDNIKNLPAVQPDVPDINVGDMIYRQAGRMTAEEAIATLKANYPDACFEQLREAVDMAIAALEQPTIIYCMDCKYFCKKSGFCTLGIGRFVYEEDFCSQAEKKGEADGYN